MTIELLRRARSIGGFDDDAVLISELADEIVRLRERLARIATSPDDNPDHLRWLASDAIRDYESPTMNKTPYQTAFYANATLAAQVEPFNFDTMIGNISLNNTSDTVTISVTNAATNSIDLSLDQLRYQLPDQLG